MEQSYKQWVITQLESLGERMKSIDAVQTSQTSAVFVVETNVQRYYFKICGMPFIHEPQLAAALNTWMPGSVPHIIAMDKVRHWLLMADTGQTLRTRIKASGDTTLSDEMLRRLASLQKQMTPHREELLHLGVPDRRLERLPVLYEDLIADTSALHLGQENGVSEVDLELLRAFGPSIRQLCAQLADYNIPETIQHDDFHSGNVSEHFQIFDWAECFIGHPFYSLLIALRDAKFTLMYDAPTLDRLQDVYLQCWTDYAPLARLREVIVITHQLAALGRALSWWQIIRQSDNANLSEDADAVPYWLLTFLHNTPLT